MPARDGRARVKRLLRAEPLRLEPVGRGLVLHEDAACARDLIPLRAQPVAGVQGEGQVVAGVDHQPVPEAVDALVGDERRRVRLDAGAEPSCDGREARVGDALEGALEDAVVVARPADRRAAGEGRADIAVEARERAGPDRVRDPVAVLLDERARPHLVDESREGDLGAAVVGEVGERLLEARRVGVTALHGPVVGLERGGDGDAALRRRARHVERNRADLLGAELRAERRHPGAAVLYLLHDPVVRGRELVEVRTGRAVRVRRRERVAAGAAGAREERGAVRCGGGSGSVLRGLAAAACEAGGEKERDAGSAHGQTIRATAARITSIGAETPVQSSKAAAP